MRLVHLEHWFSAFFFFTLQSDHTGTILDVNNIIIVPAGSVAMSQQAIKEKKIKDNAKTEIYPSQPLLLRCTLVD